MTHSPIQTAVISQDSIGCERPAFAASRRERQAETTENRCWRLSLSSGSFVWFETREKAEQFLSGLGLEESAASRQAEKACLAAQCVLRLGTDLESSRSPRIHGSAEKTRRKKRGEIADERNRRNGHQRSAQEKGAPPETSGELPAEEMRATTETP